MTFRWYSVLHIGPEPCLRDRLAAMPQLRYSAIDLYDPAAPERMDVEHLRFADRTFDLVLCSHVLEHVADDRRALSEMARVLRPGGRAVILVPLDLKRPHTFEDPSLRTPSERLAAFGHPYHRRICGADYGGRVEAAGFTVDAVPSTRLPAHHRRLYGINRNSLFECRRLRT